MHLETTPEHTEVSKDSRQSRDAHQDKSTEAGSLAEPRALIVTTIEASMRRGRDDQRFKENFP